MRSIKRRLVSSRLSAKVFCLIMVCALIISSLYLTQVVSVSNYMHYPKRISNLELVAPLKESRNGNTSTKDIKINRDNAVMLDIQEQIPNLPVTFWNRTRNKGLKLNSTCAKFPDFFDIHFNNDYWQVLETTNGTFQLFGAYLDVRTNNAFKPTIRILGMINRIKPTVNAYCQIWFENSTKPIISRIFEYKYIWVKEWGNYQQGIYQPYLMACQIPKGNWNGTAPSAITVVEKPCDRGVTLMSVFYNKPQGEKKDFAVCVKGMNFPYDDLSVKLTEWIELVHLLGADKIFFYELAVHPNVKRLLNHYEKEGKVHVTPLKLAGTQPTEPLLQYYYLKNKIIHKRQNELIPYNDCFYKHMYEYKFIILLDIDEVIMPIKTSNWKELMTGALEKSKKHAKAGQIEKAYFNVQNVYFLDDLLHNHGWFKDIPNYMHMLQHVFRSKNFTKPGFFIKSFFNTEKVLLLHNHFPLACFGMCFSYPIDKEEAQLQHYRKDCVSDLKKVCDDYRSNSVMDTTIWKFRDPLVERVTATLKSLGYSENDILHKR